MKLYPIATSQLQYLETGQFIIRLITDFENKNLDPATDPEFKTLYDSLKAQSPEYDAALMQIRAKAETEQLISLDYIRDRKITTLRNAVNVFKYTDIPAERTAYGLLKILLTVYKNIDIANFEAESLGLNNLVAELKNATYAPAVQTLGLAVHVTNLETANNNFKTTFSTRSISTINTAVYDVKLLKKNILTTYKDLVEYVFVMAKRKKTTFFVDTFTVINNGRKYFADILAKRGGSGGEEPTV
ncbi:DUF6261 family protein [Flavobacterium sp.]|uniref:DUF6261 family protein n=1 Tax=Flavobacterium sp. TaxID=239 RepID=UPI00286A0237|nr:DUF6261 family protein [Flavobacterium sp.]